MLLPPHHPQFFAFLWPHNLLNKRPPPRLILMLIGVQPKQGLKNIQDFKGAGAGGAGEPTPEAAMAKKKRDMKDIKSMKEKEGKKKAKAAEKVGRYT